MSKTVPSETTLFLSTDRDGVPDTELFDGCVSCEVLDVGVVVDTVFCFWEKTKYPATPAIMAKARITTKMFEKPLLFIIL